MADGYISQIKTPDNKTYLLRDSEKTDEKVSQASNSENKEFPIILKNTNNTTDETAGVKYAGGVTVNPDNETITAQEFKGNLNIANLIPISAKTYTTTLYNTSTGANYYQNFMTVEPTDYNAIWTIHYRLMVTAVGHSDYTAYYDCNLSGRSNTYYSYKFYNSLVNYPIYGHMYLRSNSASTPHEIGVRITSSYGADTVQKTIKVELLEQINCTATLLDSLKLYTSALPSGYAAWTSFNATSNGLQETGDNDTTGRDYSHSGYGINGPDFRLPPYTIFGYDKNQKAQGISLYEPGYASSTTALSTTRVYNTAGFAWEKGLWFSNSGTNYAPNANLDFSPAEFYYATDMRYTDNVYLHKTTASELGIVARKPLYFRGTIGNDGLFYLAPITVTHNSTNYQRVWTQDIPDSDDGYVYWFIGYAYYSDSYAASGYQANLVTENKLYWYHDGRFEEYRPASTVAWADITNKPSTATSWPNWNQIQQSGANNIEEGSANVTANTEIFTSYASNNGFADTNGLGKVYRRDASKVVNATLVKAALGTNATHNNTFLRKDGTWATALVAHQTYTAFTGNPTDNQTPGFGSTFTIQQISQSTTGQVSGTDRTVTIPAITSSDIPVTLTRAQLINTEQMAFTNWLPKYGNGTTVPAKTMALFADGLAIKSPATSADAGWIRVTGTDETDTVLEIATSDDANKANSEKIVVRQYNSSSAQHEAILLGKIGDVYGATSFPVQVTAPKFIGNLTGTADKATAANLTSTVNAIAYYTDTAGKFGSKASANGALYATGANGALQWGTLPIAQGGTGKTTANDAANILISGLPAWTANPTDDTYLIRRDTGGTSTYGQVKFSTVWNYIKGKADSVYANQTTVNGLLAAADAMIFKGTLDGAATSSNGGAGGLTPAANCGDTYKVATIGYINGEPVEVGDIIICTTDSTIASTSSNYSTVKANWVIVQNNVDGAIFKGTNGFTDTHVIIADGTNGKVKDSGFTIASSVPANAKFTDTTSFTITANATDGYWDLTGTNGTNAVTYALTPYSSKQSGANFYTGTANPDGTTRLNYNGYLYATKLYSNGTEVSVSGHTHDYAGSSSAGGAATSANALNFVHTNELLLGNANSQSGIHINHRRVSGGATSGNTAITDYYFKNGNGAVTGVTIHAAAFDGSATSAGKWTTARNISISDSDGTNTGTAVSVDGSAAVTLKLPATIKADITGDAATVNGLTVQTAVPANAVFTDTNKYHKTGSWSGLTYTATAVNSADELKFTIPNKIQTNWELNATSGNSPALLFTRDSTLTDWKVFVNSGKLSFQSATNGTTWTERAYFKDNSGDFVATSFTGKGSDLTDLNASSISSGTLNLARLGNQNANTVLAGPGSGNAATPSFRALATADIPDLGNIYVKKNSELLTTNPFAPSSLTGPYISKIDNAFYAADKRWTVTGTNISSTIALFDGNYESNGIISAGKTATITIDFDPNHNNSAYFPGYPYGYILISFYYTSGPSNVSARVYCNYNAHGIGWHNLSFSPINDNDSTHITYRSEHQGSYNISQLEITITAGSSDVRVTQIEMHLDRPNSAQTPFLSKYNAETLYYNLTAPKFIGPLEGNASTATKSGVSTIWLYPENNNEINFGGTNTGTIIYVGYRAKDSRSIPTKFVFGNSTGTADLQAKTVYLGSGTSSYISSTQYTGNASTVGGHTVEADVPSDAVFTDTTYTFDGTYNASSNKAATVSTVTNAINALDGGTIGTGSTTKTITSLSQTNGNVSATFSDIAFPVSSVAGLSGAITASNLTEALGLSKALRFVGITTTDMTGGTATNHTYTGTPAGISDYTPIVGDVVINSTKQDEWVCTAVSGTTYTWERLGSDTSYKIVQSAVSDPTAASTTSTTFIDTISQDANGVISASKKTLPNYAGSDSAGGSANTVKQTPTTGTYYNWRKLLVGTSNNSSDSFTVSNDTSGSVYQVNTISVKPAEGILKASSFIGQFTGTGDLVLKTTTADSPDIVWKYGNTTNEQEQARIWMGTGGSTKWAPQYRCYKQDGTQLYNGTLVLGDGTGASGTWAITASGNLPLTGGRLTGTLSLRPTSGEGGQINISASEENTSQTGIAIDQYNSTLRIFGIASADGTITGTGTSLIIHPYDATMEGDYRVKFKHIIATKQMIVKSGLVYYNDTTDSANDTKILAKSGMFFSDGIAFANPGLSAANDVGWIRVKGTTENNTELEIATGDDGDNATTGERIVVRQYKSSSSREAVLLEKGTGATTFPVSLSAPQLTLTSTSAVSHITFSRGGWNYITMPENDASVLSVGFGELGNNTNQRLVIFKTGTVRPGLNGGQDLGDNEHKWNNVYGINFYGSTFSGTANTANQLGKQTITNSSLDEFVSNGSFKYSWAGRSNQIVSKPTNTDAFGVMAFKTADNWTGQIFVSTNQKPGIYWRLNLTTSSPSYGNWTRLANGNANIYYGESTTAADTAIKDVTCLHYHTLNVGDILVVKFTNANSANEPQLNVNSTGNKLIRASYSGGIVSLSSATQIRDTCMFIYDGTYWIQMSTDCVKQMVTTSSESVWRSVMVSASNNASESFTPDQMFAKTYVAHNVKFQASTGTLRATKFKGTEFKLEYEHTDKAYMTWNNTDQSIDFIFV